jgi:hypothetical protein
MPKLTKKNAAAAEPVTPPPAPNLLSTLSSSNKATLTTALSHLTTLYPKNPGPTLTNVSTMKQILQLTRHTGEAVAAVYASGVL